MCDGRASNLARELIKWVFLPFWFACSHDDSLWFFDNNRTRDSNNFDRNAYIKELDQFLDSMFHRSVCGGLIVFPEGPPLAPFRLRVYAASRHSLTRLMVRQ